MKTFAALSVSLLLVASTSCSGLGGSFTPARPAGVGQGLEPLFDSAGPAATPIKHVVIIFQENRTTDFLFQGIAGADIAKYATDSAGQRVALQPTSLKTTWDLGHKHASFLTDYDNGKMDGFDRGMVQGNHMRPFAYGMPAEVAPYHDMAKQYVLGDRMFQSNQGPSFEAHLYIIAANSSWPNLRPYVAKDNPYGNISDLGGCDSPNNTLMDTIDPANGNAGPHPYPCFDRTVLTDFLDTKGVSWRWYQQGLGSGLWHAFDAIKHVRYGKDYANVITPPQTVLSDIAGGRLAGVSWVNPAHPWSDHAGGNSDSKGPSWVAAIVNAVGKSKYWNSTAIFVTWDDWGGFYDHVKPPILNHYELGFRVPLLVISPYAKKAYVSKVQHEFGSILAFTEETFGIGKGALHSTDGRADDLKDCFDFTQKPRAFVPIKAPPFVPNGYALGQEDP